MELPRKKFREYLLMLLFISEIKKELLKEDFDFLMEEWKFSRTNAYLLKEAYQNIEKNLPLIDQAISRHCDIYNIERITKIELSLLRLFLFEWKLSQSITKDVAFQESTRLCSKYGSPQSQRFLHAMLDRVELLANQRDQINEAESTL